MKLAQDVNKRIVILLWCIVVSLFLWFFAIIMKPEFDFFQFINFCIILFGGGFAYHIVIELIKCPYEESNSKNWSNILRALLIVFVGYVIAGCSLGIGKCIGNGFGWLVAFFGLLVGMFWSLHFLLKLDQPIRELFSSNHAIHSDGNKRGGA